MDSTILQYSIRSRKKWSLSELGLKIKVFRVLAVLTQGTQKSEEGIGEKENDAFRRPSEWGKYLH